VSGYLYQNFFGTSCKGYVGQMCRKKNCSRVYFMLWTSTSTYVELSTDAE